MMEKKSLKKIIEIIRSHLYEEVPTNNASSGNIAGLPPDQPPVRKRKKQYMSGGYGIRKLWLNDLKNK